MESEHAAMRDNELTSEATPPGEAIYSEFIFLSFLSDGDPHHHWNTCVTILSFGFVCILSVVHYVTITYRYDAPASSTLSAVLLNDVINNIQLVPDYYQVIEFVVVMTNVLAVRSRS